MPRIIGIFGIVAVMGGFLAIIWSQKPACEPGYVAVLDRFYTWACAKGGGS